MVSPAFSQHIDHHHDSPSPHTVPIRFIPNQKQWPAEVRYRAEIPGGHLYLEDTGWKYVFYDQEAIRQAHASPQTKHNERLRGHSLSVKMQGASPRAQIRASQSGPEKYNFFLGKDPQQWAGNLSAFRQIGYYNIYPGINLKLLPNEQTLKYEFEILPYADSRAIAFSYEGADRIFLQDGNLHLQTSMGEIIEKKPYCYQLIEGQKKEVPSEFLLSGQEVRFHFPEGYDRSQALIIDPELVFSTYSGSVSDNWGSTATFDNEGNLYSGGIVFGAGFPTTSGAFDLSFGGGFDVGILKFSADGTELRYATYLGGNDAEFPHSMIVDNQNNLIILGTTSSLNFPITSGAFQTSFAGGQAFQPLSGLTYGFGSDLFISKLNASGNALLGSTFLGGSTNDGINVSAEAGILNYGDQFRGEIIVDTNNDIYIASTTTSANFPVANAVQGNRRGSQDGVVCKLNPNLTSLIWSTFLGGGAFDAAYSLKINPVNNDLYIAGPTRSNDLRSIVPATAPVPFRATWSGNDDGYIARFTTNGQLVQITYLGTTANDQVYFLDFDPEGNPHAVGLTFGTYPVSAGVYSNPNSGQFIDKLNENLTARFFSTVVGTGQGGPDITITAVLVNDCGNIYLAGWGSSSVSGGNLSTFGLPVTADAYKSGTDGQDFYLMILEKMPNPCFMLLSLAKTGAFRATTWMGALRASAKTG
ncbi:MAG: hypothetical protein HC913_17215 [Microscillaceae bacterium]|nr:hypothetical protein [Microscillaceae bacterium]